MQKILNTTEQTTEEELKLRVNKAPQESNVVKVTFPESGLEKYVEKDDFVSYHCHIELKAEIGIATIKKGKVIKFKSVGWPEISKKELNPKPKEEEKTNELVYPEPDTTAYKVWQISDRFYNNADNTNTKNIPDIEIIIKAAQGISIKKVATKAHFNKWKKWKLSRNKELTRKPKKRGRKSMAKKKPTTKKVDKKKTLAKKKVGRPPGKATKKKATKKVSKKKTAKKDPAKKKRGRPSKAEAGERKLATKPKGSDHYYQPSSNTSIV